MSYHFSWTLPPSRRLHASGPAWSSKRAGTFWTWNACRSFRFWRPKVHQHAVLVDDVHLGSASADTQLDRGNGSRLYKVNIWMWRYGRGRPRMVSIAEAERIRKERISESRIRAAEMRKRRSEAAAASGAAEGGGGAQ